MPESWPCWPDNGHKKFSILAILAKVIKVLSFIQILHYTQDLGQVWAWDKIDILVCLRNNCFKQILQPYILLPWEASVSY